MKFIIVDDNKAFREGIIYYLENILLHEVIGIAGDGIEFLEMGNHNEADIILMDIEMPTLNGIDTVRQANWKNPALKFIAVTSYTNQAYLLELINVGFKGCVFKTEIYDQLDEAIAKVLNDEYFFPEDMNVEKH